MGKMRKIVRNGRIMFAKDSEQPILVNLYTL
jgi:hypothetical protein